MIDFNFFKQKSPQQRFLFILGLVMLSLYLALGILLIFWKDIPFDITPTYRILFGILLIAYAILRFYRLINKRED
ncbi:uncharacterized membrane protein (DUF485 family) [Pedobacter sp. CAN_A7]|uniref:hypothetical protein n=1 Tax=Pedobacter sp. CAN_A7 TaxID=2787722 RepID=UPI0018C96232